MHLLIVSATSIEIEPLLKKFSKGRALQSNLTRYRYRKIQVDVLITGVGMVSTTYWSALVLHRYKYDAAINAGICGCFDRKFSLGQVVNVISDMFPEIGSESGEYFLSLVDLKLLEQDEFPFREGRLLNDSVFNSKALSELADAKGVTVNTVHGNSDSIARFRTRFDADIESMEGAAFFFTCFHQRVRCIQIRAISNYIEPRDPSQWNIALAIHNLNHTLLTLLTE